MSRPNENAPTAGYRKGCFFAWLVRPRLAGCHNDGSYYRPSNCIIRVLRMLPSTLMSSESRKSNHSQSDSFTPIGKGISSPS